jgi:hypothetical protein
MILHRRVALFTLPVVALLSISGCSLPQAVRDAAAPLSDDRLVPAPEVQAFFTSGGEAPSALHSLSLPCKYLSRVYLRFAVRWPRG